MLREWFAWPRLLIILLLGLLLLLMIWYSSRAGQESVSNDVMAEGQVYTSQALIHMNLLSSYLDPAGDSGETYLRDGKDFVITNRQTGDVKRIESVKWGWQPVTWSQDEWESYFVLYPETVSQIRLNEARIQPLSDDYCLLLVDQKIWLVEFRTLGQRPEPQIWSIYQIGPDQS